MRKCKNGGYNEKKRKSIVGGTERDTDRERGRERERERVFRESILRSPVRNKYFN